MSKTLLAHSCVNFALDHECEKSRLEEVTNESASLVSSLNLGSEEYVQLEGEEIVEAKYNTVELGGFGTG